MAKATDKTENAEAAPAVSLAALDARVAELNERLTAVPDEPLIDAALMEQHDKRISELQRLVSNLGEKLASVQAINARDAQFNAAVQSVDAAAAAVQQSILAPPPRVNADAQSKGRPTAIADCSCHDGPCGCVSCDCCTFEVWMSHVRVDSMQIPVEIDDSNIQPMADLECWMFASIDPLHNIGACIPDPSPASFLALHKQITDPYGPWVSVNRCIGSATVKKGSPLTVPLTLTAVEREPDRAVPLNRDEWGSATEHLTLDCCYSNYSPIHIPVSMTSWGQGGGAITGKFIVVKKC